MNLIDLDAGVMATLPIVGTSIPLGVGLALAEKQQGTDGVIGIYFGDAAIEEGAFHEAVVNRILDDLVALLQPRFMEVVGDFNVRGGIYTTVSARHGEPPAA